MDSKNRVIELMTLKLAQAEVDNAQWQAKCERLQKENDELRLAQQQNVENEEK